MLRRMAVPPSHTSFSWLHSRATVPTGHTAYSWTAGRVATVASVAAGAGTDPRVTAAGGSARADVGAGAGRSAPLASVDGRPASLLHAALDVMTTANTDDKAARTLAYAALWSEGCLPVVASGDVPTAPDAPARPDDIEMVHPSKARSSGKRGLLHSLVHAESYAIDLSWDIMLRFAHCGGVSGTELLPEEFFHNWVRVAREESEHYAKWSNRLQELGGHYGMQAAHDGLWQAASETAHSLLARLAIVHCVHEARGLDVYPGSVRKLEKSGDQVSIDILNGNYREEIGHVGYGMKWLKHLCGLRGEDPVATYHSLVRKHFQGTIKGPFNHEARAQAGMTPEYYEPLAKSAS